MNMPEPLSPHKGTWGWQSIYRPAIAIEPDNNHIIRHHLRSRTLWSHHGNWGRELDSIWYLINQVRQAANNIYTGKLSNNSRQYTKDYLNTALWQSFEVACNRTLRIDYKVPENQKGLSFGAYIIETSIATTKDRNMVEKEHRDLSDEIAQTDEMKNLVNLSIDIIKLQEAMQAIAMKALKSSDILYPCRFCRHLWK